MTPLRRSPQNEALAVGGMHVAQARQRRQHASDGRFNACVLISVRNWAEFANYFRYALTRLREREARFSFANSVRNGCAGVIIPP